MTSPAKPALPEKPARRRKFPIVSTIVLILLLPVWISLIFSLLHPDPCGSADSVQAMIFGLAAFTLPWLDLFLWRLKNPQREKRVPAVVFLTFPVCFGIVILGAIYVPGLLRSSSGLRMGSARNALEKINAAEAAYASKYKTYSPSLSALGPAPTNTQSNGSAAGLIDADLAGGRRGTYTFLYTPGPRDSTGRVTAYTVTARSKCGGDWDLFTDHTGNIRRTLEDLPATRNDPSTSK